MSSLRGKRFLARIWRMRAREPDRRMILLYHAVGSGPAATPPDLFRSHMEWLASNTSVVGLEQLLSGNSVHPRPLVSITFDDGYRSVAAVAQPIMASLGQAGTIYVNSRCIADRGSRSTTPALGHYEGEEFMDWSTLAGLVANGWLVGSHGCTHADLTAVPDLQLSEELTGSRSEIERRLGATCCHFAYTWGRYTTKVRQAVIDAGYRTAASAIHGPLNASSDQYALPRIDIAREYTARDLESIVNGDWDFLRSVQRIRRVVRNRGLS